MDKDRIPFVLSIVIIAASLLAGIWKGEGMAVGVCLVALVVSVPAALYCSPNVSRYSIIASVSALLCAAFMITVVPKNALFMGGETDLVWIYTAALMTGAALIAQAVLFLFVVAARSGASYNWVMVFGLGWLISLGMTIPKTLMVLVLRHDETHSVFVSNPVTVIGLMVNLIMFITFFAAAGLVLKRNRYIITRNGTEAMR